MSAPRTRRSLMGPVVCRWLLALGLGTWLVLTAPAVALSQGRPVPEEIIRLHREVQRLERQGRYGDAIPLAARLVVLIEERLGSQDPNFAGALGVLGELYRATGQYGRAEPFLRRSVELKERIGGPDHPSLAVALNGLAALYSDQGRYQQAEPLYRRSLAILERARGPDHPDVATLLTSLGELYRHTARHRDAEALFRRALAIYEQRLGPDHEFVAAVLNNLALSTAERGDLTAAETLHQRSLAILEKSLGSDHPQVAASLKGLALLYLEAHAHARAEAALRRALAIEERALGPNHPEVAKTLNSLAGVRAETGRYREEEPLLRRALAIQEQALGPEHPAVGLTLVNLGALMWRLGDYPRAEPLFLRALALREKAFGPEHPQVALALNNLAEFYGGIGQYGEAERTHRRALAIYEKAFGPEHPAAATSMANLAVLYRAMNRPAEAEALAMRAAAAFEKTFGPEHPRVATSLSDLAALARARGDTARAVSLNERALAIKEKVLGPEHPSVATSLNNLAEAMRQSGDLARAKSLHERALAIRERALGPNHPVVASSLDNLAWLTVARGETARAVSLKTRAEEITEYNLRLVLPSGSEARKLSYMATLAGATWTTLTMHTAAAPQDPTAVRLALTTIARRKGRVLDATVEGLEALRRRLGPDDRTLLDRLSAVRAELAALVLAGPGKQSPDAHRARVGALEAEALRLEGELATRSAEFRAQAAAVTLERVQAAMPPGAVLLEFALYRPLRWQARTAEDQWAAPRYVAYVLPGQGPPSWVDLGEAEPIDQEIGRFRVALASPYSDAVKSLGRALDERIMRRLRPLLGGSRRVLVAPDGALNLVPFQALVDETGRYLIETFDITYLTSARDLLRLQVTTSSQHAPLVMADPDFDQAASAGAPAADAERSAASGRRSENTPTLVFGPLPGTAGEAQALRAILPRATVVTRGRATETALRAARGPEVLHIATHGFFLPDQPIDPRGAGGLSEENGLPAPGVRLENPMLRSGLALAGANRRQGGGDDGLLTALEAASLDLWGTRLVVLSACETGVGTVARGEGVFGLRRALVIAGSETQVMSLWKVDDEATRDLMTAYYRRLVAGEGRSPALRHVQLSMLASRDAGQHPYYWASFILSGQWAPLR